MRNHQTFKEQRYQTFKLILFSNKLTESCL
jgi:hypothetical protein